MVDDEDFEVLNKYRWRLVDNKRNSTYYAKRVYRVGDRKLEKKKEVLLHREILGLTNPKELCDHKDGNGLNCQKSNIRKCNSYENNRNRAKKKNATSKYLGVHLHKNNNGKNKYWVASILGKAIGRFKYTESNEIEAAKLYDIKAKEYFGEFANPNFK